MTDPARPLGDERHERERRDEGEQRPGDEQKAVPGIPPEEAIQTSAAAA